VWGRAAEAAMAGLGRAAVSVVAISLIAMLFTGPSERTKAMGVFRFVMSGGSIGALADRVLTAVAGGHWGVSGQRAGRARRRGRRKAAARWAHGARSTAAWTLASRSRSPARWCSRCTRSPRATPG
jgi:hypothetical protein